MTITKCDTCKKRIERADVQFAIMILGGAARYVNNHAVCLKCGKPITALLKKNNLTQRENRKHRQYKGLFTR